MATSKNLRDNTNQHLAKNRLSKIDDKEIYRAMLGVIDYLEERLGWALDGYRLSFQESVSYRDMIKVICSGGGGRTEFDETFLDRTIKPDGGLILLHKESDDAYLRVVLVSEVKRQGTNDARVQEGKAKQAQGNAIERLGKNLTGIKAMLNYEKITPFVCFGWGCDFVQNYTSQDFVMAKISMLNEFYPLNKVYINKKDGFAPTSMFFREKRWSETEMLTILKEVGESALRYYIF